jgi:hypothetical protein
VTYPDEATDRPYHMHMLAFAPLLDETNQTAQNHADWILSVLQHFHIPIANLICLIGDNCSTNKATANLLNLPLLGCRSHRLNLAVEKFIRDNLGVEMAKVKALMKKLTTSNESGKLRLSTHLRPVKRNKTRWTGAANMFRRYERILKDINVADASPEVLELLPSPAENHNIRSQIHALENLVSVTVTQQHRDTTLSNSNFLYRTIIAEHPDAESFQQYLLPTSPIVHCPTFENAIVKIQEKKEGDLTEEEAESVACLLRDGAAAPVFEGSFAERMLKRQRVEVEATGTSMYVNTNFLLPTSNEVERLFSQAKRVFSPHRTRMDPSTLEALLFLNQNRNLFNVKTVALVMNEYDAEMGAGGATSVSNDDMEDDDFDYFYE